MSLPIRQNLLTLTCIKSTPKTVLVEVCELAENGKKGGCFASNTTLARDLGISLKTVTRMVALLEASGLLTSHVVKAEGNRRYLTPTAAVRACYIGGTEAQQLAAAAELTIVKNPVESILTIVKNEPDYSQKEDLTIVKNGLDYSQKSSRVIGDDQYDHKTTKDDQPLAASERLAFQKKIGDLQQQVADLKAQLARQRKAPPVAAAPPRIGHRDFSADWPPQLRPPFPEPAFREAWARWAAYRYEIGKAFAGDVSEQADLDKMSELAAGSLPKALKIITDTISANWKKLTYDDSSNRTSFAGQRTGTGRPGTPAHIETLPTYGRNRGSSPSPSAQPESTAVAA